MDHERKLREFIEAQEDERPSVIVIGNSDVDELKLVDALADVVLVGDREIPVVDLRHNPGLAAAHAAVQAHSVRFKWQPVEHSEPPKKTTPGRKQPCLCGSGKKYKRCCLKGK